MRSVNGIAARALEPMILLLPPKLVQRERAPNSTSIWARRPSTPPLGVSDVRWCTLPTTTMIKRVIRSSAHRFILTTCIDTYLYFRIVQLMVHTSFKRTAYINWRISTDPFFFSYSPSSFQRLVLWTNWNWLDPSILMPILSSKPPTETFKRTSRSKRRSTW